jgi:hypothetical protein
MMIIRKSEVSPEIWARMLSQRYVNPEVREEITEIDIDVRKVTYYGDVGKKY